MKGRLLITFVVLAVAAAACAEPGLVGGDDVAQESESVTDDAVSDDTSTSEVPAGEELTADPQSASSKAPSPEEEPATDPDDQTTSTTADDSPLVTNPPKETPSTTTTSVSGGAAVDPSLAPFIDQAKADLAGRLGVDAGAIAVINAELVEWSDTSLGCPQPDMLYAQIPTDGSLIVLSHGGFEYRYHTGGSVYVPFLCE